MKFGNLTYLTVFVLIFGVCASVSAKNKAFKLRIYNQSPVIKIKDAIIEYSIAGGTVKTIKNKNIGHLAEKWLNNGENVWIKIKGAKSTDQVTIKSIKLVGMELMPKTSKNRNEEIGMMATVGYSKAKGESVIGRSGQAYTAGAGKLFYKNATIEKTGSFNVKNNDTILIISKTEHDIQLKQDKQVDVEEGVIATGDEESKTEPEVVMPEKTAE